MFVHRQRIKDIDCLQVGGGSLRMYRRDIQEKVLAAIGLTSEQV